MAWHNGPAQEQCTTRRRGSWAVFCSAGMGVAFVDSANLVVEDGADQITRNMATMIRPAVLLMSTPEMTPRNGR